MGCHDAERFQGLPAVDLAQAVDLLGLGPDPRIEERVVVADDHVARGVAELRREELGIAAADQRARDVAAAQRLLGVALARTHLGALQHALPASVAPVVVVERVSGLVREDPALRAADVGERPLAPEKIRERPARGNRPARARLRRLDSPTACRGALHVDQAAALRHVRPPEPRPFPPAQARQDENLRQREPHPLHGVAGAAQDLEQPLQLRGDEGPEGDALALHLLAVVLRPPARKRYVERARRDESGEARIADQQPQEGEAVADRPL
jgi:hypothetical protein